MPNLLVIQLYVALRLMIIVYEEIDDVECTMGGDEELVEISEATEALADKLAGYLQDIAVAQDARSSADLARNEMIVRDAENWRRAVQEGKV